MQRFRSSRRMAVALLAAAAMAGVLLPTHAADATRHEQVADCRAACAQPLFVGVGGTDSGRAFMFQYPEGAGDEVVRFLDEEPRR